MGVATLERFLLTPQAGIPLQPKSCCTRKLAMVDGLRCVRNERSRECACSHPRCRTRMCWWQLISDC